MSRLSELLKLKKLTGKSYWELVGKPLPNFDGGKDDELRNIVDTVNKSSANFVNRLKDPNRQTIRAWEDPLRSIATHKLAYYSEGDNDVVFPMVQQVGNKLIDYTNPAVGTFNRNILFDRAIQSAEQRGDTVRIPKGTGEKFTTRYKNYYPSFDSGKDGDDNPFKQFMSNLKDVASRKAKKAIKSLEKKIKDGTEDIKSLPKDLVYSVMVSNNDGTSGVDRDEYDVLYSLLNKKDLVNQRGDIDRNLSSLYVYGNDLNQFEEAENLRNIGVNYDSYLKGIGRNPQDVRIYKGNIPEDIILPKAIMQQLPQYIKSIKNKTYGKQRSEDIEGDDVAGYLQRLDLDESGNPVLVNSDLWDFYPKEYADNYNEDPKKYAELYAKAKMLDQAGNPFILKDVRPILFVDDDRFYSRYNILSDIEKAVAKDFGYLPPAVVTPEYDDGKDINSTDPISIQPNPDIQPPIVENPYLVNLKNRFWADMDRLDQNMQDDYVLYIEPAIRRQNAENRRKELSKPIVEANRQKALDNAIKEQNRKSKIQKNFNSFNNLQNDLLDSVSSLILTGQDIAKAAKKIEDDKQQAILNELDKNKLMAKSLLTAAQFYTGMLGLTRGVAGLSKWLSKPTSNFNYRMSSLVTKLDQQQAIMNGLGIGTNAVLLSNTLDKQSDAKNVFDSIQLGANILGLTGASNYLNLPRFGKIGNITDKLLDGVGYIGAGSDFAEGVYNTSDIIHDLNKYDDGKDPQYIGGSDLEYVVTPTTVGAWQVGPYDPNIDYQFYSPSGNSIIRMIGDTLNWLKYWGDKGGASVSRTMNDVGHKIMPYAIGITNPISMFGGLVGEVAGSDIGRKLGNEDLGTFIGGAIGGGLTDLDAIESLPQLYKLAKSGYRRAKKYITAKQRVRRLSEYLDRYTKDLQLQTNEAELQLKKYDKIKSSTKSMLINNFTNNEGEIYRIAENKTRRSRLNIDDMEQNAIDRLKQKYGVDFDFYKTDLGEIKAGITVNDEHIPNNTNIIRGELPLFGTDRRVQANISINTPNAKSIVYPIDGYNELPTTNPIKILEYSNVYNSSMNLEYVDALRKNIQYVKQQIPGSVPYGSSVAVTEAGLPHFTDDIDVFIPESRLKGIEEKFGNRNKWDIKVLGENPDTPDTYTVKLDDDRYGKAGNIDLNVIYSDADGNATGQRAIELYRQLYPDEFQKAYRLALKIDPIDPKIKINKTPEELVDAVNTNKTLMDTFEIDPTKPKKGKHGNRVLYYMNNGNPDQIYNAITSSFESFVGSNARHLNVPLELFSNPERNKKLLELMDMTKYADGNVIRDPKRMRNFAELWWQNNTTLSRGTKPGLINNTGASLEQTLKNMTEWSGGDGGIISGAGMNTVAYGNSGHLRGGVYGQILPNIPQLDGKQDIEEIIDIVNKSYGRTKDQLVKVQDQYMDVKSALYHYSLLHDPDRIANTHKVARDNQIIGLSGKTDRYEKFTGVLKKINEPEDIVFITPTRQVNPPTNWYSRKGFDIVGDQLENKAENLKSAIENKYKHYYKYLKNNNDAVEYSRQILNKYLKRSDDKMLRLDQQYNNLDNKYRKYLKRNSNISHKLIDVDDATEKFIENSALYGIPVFGAGIGTIALLNLADYENGVKELNESYSEDRLSRKDYNELYEKYIIPNLYSLKNKKEFNKDLSSKLKSLRVLPIKRKKKNNAK